jgi:hypothetical protein
MKHKINVLDRVVRYCLICCLFGYLSANSNLFAQNPPKLTNDYVHVLNTPANIDVLANDKLDYCPDRNSLVIDTVAGNRLRYGSLIINSDRTFTYTPRAGVGGMDSIEYSVGCASDIRTAKLYVIVSRPMSRSYTACPSTDVHLDLQPLTNVSYSWYDAATGGKLLKPASDKYILSKNTSAEQSVYIEAKYNGITFAPRKELKVFYNKHCGTTNPPDCASKGRILFGEDFGGNNISDPAIKSTGIPQVIGYTYSRDFNKPGQYVIAKKNPAKYPGWYSMTDHTHPKDSLHGYLLAFDAADEPGQFYEHRIDGLCAGTSLYFSTWIVSLMNKQAPNKVNLTFLVEDLNKNLLAVYYTGNVPDAYPVWKSYGFEFTVPDGESSVIMRIINNGAGSSGNDVAFDDIEIRFCSPPVTNGNQPNNTVCYFEPFTFKFSYTDDGSFTTGNHYLTGRVEYSKTADFSNPVILKNYASASTVLDVNHTINNVLETDEGYYRLTAGNYKTIGHINCVAVSDPVFLKVRTVKAVNDVALTIFGKPVDINPLANDNPGCTIDRKLLTTDTIAGKGLKYGSITINPDKTLTYTPKGNVFGIDSIDYKLIYSRNQQIFTDTARIYIAILKPLSEYNLLCPNTTYTIGMNAIPDVEFYWYNAPSGGTLVHKTAANQFSVTKDNSTEQAWYLEPVFKKTKLPVRYKLSILKSDNCGTTSPAGCAVDGKLLFNEDFRGNSESDPTYGTEPLPKGITTCNFKTGNYIEPNEYTLVKTSTTKPDIWHRNFSDHTHAGNNKRGYMFMVDAAETPTQFYEYKIPGLCDNIDKLYFSIWVANLMIQEASQYPHDPVLKFVLTDRHDNILATYITPPVPRDKDGALKWRNYGFAFDPKGNSSITLAIYNNMLGSRGNDFVMDDIEVRLCVPDITVESRLTDTVCSGTPFTLKASYDDDETFTGKGVNMAYRWEHSTDGKSWTALGADTVASSKLIRSQYAVVSARSENKGYYRILVSNAGTLDSPECRVSSEIIYRDVIDIPKATDLRIIIPHMTSQQTVYLTGFLDTIYSPLVNWERYTAYAPGFTDKATGALYASDFTDKMIYTYKYTVSTKCGSTSAKAYILTSSKTSPANNKEIFICKDLESSKYVQLNQITGLFDNGVWTYLDDTDGIIKSNVKTCSSKYAGARIFNAQKAYDEAMKTTSYTVAGKPEVRAFKFRVVSLNGTVCEFTIMAGR